MARSAMSKAGDWGRKLANRIRPTPYAGGIVVRVAEGAAQVLIVTTRASRKRWVLPKGRVEKGESPGAAALREVREESGVTGRLLGFAGDAEYLSTKGYIRIEYYLIEYLRTRKNGGEDRLIEWCPVEDAIQRLTYASARRVLLQANEAIVDYAAKRSRNAGKQR
ncbi:MAG TPA: NUDIX domain-containing protein [Gemmatimonadaceae bacterium]|jgi:8-oxo-dGTP pyrophosphatase MutT (NUDIX family)|nr:NUDIX domain-containing protein [Gemmatimonadaceae bacterium]